MGKIIILSLLLMITSPSSWASGAPDHGTSVSNVGAVSVETTDPSTASSCTVLKERIFYDILRETQDRALAIKLSRKSRLSADDIANIKRFTNRLQSRVPGYGTQTRLITVEWNLNLLRPNAFDEIQKQLNVSEKFVQIVDLVWQTTGGYLPQDLELKIDDARGVLQLRYLSNPVDVCFGNDDIYLNLKLPSAEVFEFRATLPMLN